MLSNRRSASRWLAALCTVTFVVLAGLGVGCSKDDIVGDATAEAVENQLDDALNDTVEPLVVFLGQVPTIVAGGPGLRSSLGLGLACPDTTGVCGGGGSVVCTVVGLGSQLSFDFDECVVVTGDDPLTLDGVVLATPGDPIALELNSLFINNHGPMTGTGSVSVSGCSYVVNIGSTDNVSVNGTIIQCDTDNYPTNQSFLTIWLDDVAVEISFDGSSVANALAFNGKTEIADCNINLAADPLNSSCEAP